MIIYKCDCCENEMDMKKNGVSVYLYLKWEKFGKQNIQPIRVEENYCEDCTSKIQSEIQKIKVAIKEK